MGAQKCILGSIEKIIQGAGRKGSNFEGSRELGTPPYGVSQMLSALHAACLGGIIVVINASLLKMIEEAIKHVKRYIMLHHVFAVILLNSFTVL